MEYVKMLARLLEMFAAGPSSAGSACRNRVNLQRRFTILADMSSQGSMSHVYKAIDQETGRTVCLKVQNREKNAAAAARASREESRPREGAIAIEVVHPHVVRHPRVWVDDRRRALPGDGFYRRSQLSVPPRCQTRADRPEGGVARPGGRGPCRRPCGGIHSPRRQPAKFLAQPRTSSQADRFRARGPQHAGVSGTGKPDRDPPVHGP